MSQIQHSLRVSDTTPSNPPTITSTGSLTEVVARPVVPSGQLTDRSTGLLILLQCWKKEEQTYPWAPGTGDSGGVDRADYDMTFLITLMYINIMM